MSFTHALSTNRYGEADLIVSTNPANGTHTTLALAMAAATSGQTIFLRDSVTENVTITPGVNIAAWYGSDASTPSITGTLTMTGAGTSTISGLRLVTNSAAIIAVTGSAASILNVNNCYLDISNNTGITFSSSDSGAMIFIEHCRGNIGTTGITLITHTSAGQFSFNWSSISNPGLSTTASTISSGVFNLFYAALSIPLTSSSTGLFNINQSVIENLATNTTSVTTAGTGATNVIINSRITSGSASAISIGSGTTLSLGVVSIASTNTNPITGAGTLNYSGIDFETTGNIINVTTQNNSMSGTWTPTVVGTVAGITTYTTQAGFYTISEGMVTVWGRIVITAATGTGNVIFNLPFAIKTLTDYTVVGQFSIASGAWAWPVGTTQLVAQGTSSGTDFAVVAQGTLAVAFLQTTNGAANFTYCLTYQI